MQRIRNVLTAKSRIALLSYDLMASWKLCLPEGKLVNCMFLLNLN